MVSYQTPKILSYSRGTSQNASLANNQYLKILTKPGMASTSTQNIDHILERLHRMLPISITFPNIEPVPLTKGTWYGSKGTWTFT